MTTAAPLSVEHALDHYSALVSASIEHALADVVPEQWLGQIVLDYPRRGGKTLRAALCLSTCEAFGGTVDDALVSATAVELLHNAFLVHDDIADESELRRRAPTLHLRHGQSLALNAGDALAVLAQHTLHRNIDLLGGRMAAIVAREFDTMARRTVEGQAIELGWIRDAVFDLDASDYLDLVMRKTCWYTTVHPMRVGALIGTWGTADLDVFVRFGFLLGAAFQIRDDVLNLVAAGDGYGKEPLGDLLEGKRTLMLIHLVEALPASERAELVAWLKGTRADRSASEAAEVLDLMQRCGSIDYATAVAEGIAEQANAAFVDAFAPVAHTPAAGFVRDLVQFMLRRSG